MKRRIGIDLRKGDLKYNCRDIQAVQNKMHKQICSSEQNCEEKKVDWIRIKETKRQFGIEILRQFQLKLQMKRWFGIELQLQNIENRIQNRIQE